MEAGHLALVDYGEVPRLYHTRLLLAPTTGTNWVILTPDFDRYEEQMDHLNVDFSDFIFLGSQGVIPAHIPAHEVYSFAPMNAGLLAHHMTLGKVEANAIRQSRGVGPIGGGAPLAPAPAAAPAAPAAAPAGILVGGHGPAAAPAAAVAGAGGISFLDCSGGKWWQSTW